MKILPMALALLIAGIVIGAFVSTKPPDPAGDIAEYYGITESLLRHQSIALTPEDQEALSSVLPTAYFTNPGYYIPGKDGARYPVHFAGYGLLAAPVRAIVQWMGLPSLHVFSLLNTVIFSITVLIILHVFSSSFIQKLGTVILLWSSPIIFFLWWPGPDVLWVCFLLLALLFYFKGREVPAMLLAAGASWVSQPLLVTSLMMYVPWLYRHIPHLSDSNKQRRVLLITLLLLAILSVPFLINMHLFGTFTPWTILADGWTRLYGFGLHNISAHKLYEQFLDLNFGVFWFAPVITIMGLWMLVYNFRSPKFLWTFCMVLMTLFAFQTNPAWHYGTAGFGPSRHALVMLPFFLVVLLHVLKHTKQWLGFMGVVLISQLVVLSMNNYIFPVFSNTLAHSPIATFVLQTNPSLYTPTPEIFVDRTNHTDLDYPTSAIYMHNGVCRKAYILPADIDSVIAQCGSLGKTNHATIVRPQTDGFYSTYE